MAKLPAASVSADLLSVTPTSMILDYAAVRLNPDRAKGKHIVLNVVLTDTKEKHLITVENEVLVHEEGVSDANADATVTMSRADLLQTLIAGVPVVLKTGTGAIKVEGKSAAYGELTGLIDPVDANFSIVTPD